MENSAKDRNMVMNHLLKFLEQVWIVKWPLIQLVR